MKYRNPHQADSMFTRTWQVVFLSDKNTTCPLSSVEVVSSEVGNHVAVKLLTDNFIFMESNTNDKKQIKDFERNYLLI